LSSREGLNTGFSADIPIDHLWEMAKREVNCILSELHKVELKGSDYFLVASGPLNVVKSPTRTNQIVSFGRNRHMIGLSGPSQSGFIWPETTVDACKGLEM
jgi:hypothetical protein